MVVRDAWNRVVARIDQRRAGAVAVPDPDRGACDHPRPGSHHTGAFAVDGWVTTAAPLDRLEMVSDGRHLGWMRLHTAYRAAAGATPDEPPVAMCGFEHLAPSGTLAPGTHQLAFIAHSDGRRFEFAGPEIVIDPLSEPEPVPGLDHVEALTAAAIDRLASQASAGRRVLVALHSADIGGAQLYLDDILIGVLDAGVDLVAVAPSWGPMADRLAARGVAVHVVGRNAVAAHEYEAYVAELARLATDVGVDMVLANTLMTHAFVDMAARAGLPSVWFVQESAPIDVFHTWVFGEDVLAPHAVAGARRALSEGSAVVFAADSTADLFVDEIPEARRLWSPSGISIEPFVDYRTATDRDALRASIGLDPDEVVLLCSGVFAPRKSQAVLVEVARRLVDHPRRWRLVLMGAVAHGHAYSNETRDLIERLGLQDRIIVLPVIDDTMPWYLAADALVSASDLESYPRSILEAMLLGCAVVSTDVYGVVDIVEDGATGLLCPPRDVAALTEVVDRYLRMSPTEQAAMSRRAHEVADERFGVRPMQDAFTGLVTGLLADPTVDPASVAAPGRRHRR